MERNMGVWESGKITEMINKKKDFSRAYEKHARNSRTTLGHEPTTK